VSLCKRRGIILAGGSGTRLYPLTNVLSKQLMPIYDKPMIYYPISTLMISDIRDFLIISTPSDIHLYQKLLSDGSQWGINITYACQPIPNGIANAFTIGDKFIDHNPSALILGDNIFYGANLSNELKEISAKRDSSTIFGYRVEDPERYGVVTFDEDYNVINLEEKPTRPASNYAITGLYFYDSDVVDYAKTLKPSKRGELEITDLNKIYLKDRKLNVKLLGKGVSWFDTGTHSSLLDAANFVQMMQLRQGIQISCPEEIAWRAGWINTNELEIQAIKQQKNGYGQYLIKLINDESLINK